MYKKFLSVVLALAMVLPMILQCGAALEDWGYEEWPDGEEGGNQYVEAPYFESAPTIDGIITEAEWGKRTVAVWSSDSATVDEKQSYYASFFYWINAENGGGTDVVIEYDLWLRWTETKFYVGVKVRDYDGHSQKNSQGEAWNGDAIEFRVDPYGANVSGDLAYPWSDHYSIPYITAAYSELGGGFFECYDNAIWSEKGLTKNDDPKWGAVDLAIAPAGSNYSDDTKAGYTTYELAIPWRYIFENENYNSSTDDTPVVLSKSEWSPRRNPYGAYGMELGMSLTVINAPEGSRSYTSVLEWGSGITTFQMNYAPQTLSGSNGVILTDATVTPQAGYPTADPSVLENAGEKEFAGEDVFYDYLNFDFDRTNPLTSPDQLTTLTYEDVIDPNAEIKTSPDQDFWGSLDLFMGSVADAGGDHGYVLNYDRAIYNETYDDGTQFVAGVDPIPSYYLATDYAPDAGWRFPTSYTFEFDIRYLGTEITQEGRAPVLVNWFGGASAVAYEMGYDFALGAFVAREFMGTGADAMREYELVEDQWYNWRFQFDNESGTARLYINGELMLDVQNRNYHYADANILEEGTGLYFWFMNTQVQFDNVKIYNLYDYGEGTSGDEPAKPEYKKGDVNLDGSVNITDMFTLKMILTGQAEFEEDITNAADVTGDASINITDLYQLKYILINN